MCEWQSELDLDYRCKVPPEPGSKYCIFHEPGKKDIERFKKKFYEQIDEEGPEEQRNPRYNFMGYVFPVGIATSGDRQEKDKILLPQLIEGPIRCSIVTIRGHAEFFKATVKGHVSFEHAVVEGKVIFQDATIGGSVDFSRGTIGGGVFFGGARIKGPVNFQGAAIKGDIVFEHATIGEHAYFLNACIERHAFFQGVTINGDGSFYSVKIGGNVDFRDSVVHGELSFPESLIKENALFRLATIKGKFSLAKSTIGGEAHFNRSVFEGMSDFRGATFKGKVEFNGARFELQAAFEDSTFEKAVDFVFCRANAVRLGPGRPTILRLVPKRCGGVVLRDPTTAQSFWHFAHQAFEREGKRERADAAYYFERLCQMSPWQVTLDGKWWEKRNWIRHLQRLRIILFRWLPDCIFLRWPIAYGASLSRLLITWVVVVGGFASIYYLSALKGLDLFSITSPGLAWPFSFGRALYFSIVTFTTLGYGDIRPLPGLGSALTSAEAVLGGIVIALTVLVIGRKFMR